MMDIDSNQILHMVTIDKCQVGLQSPNMEKQALEHCMEFPICDGVIIMI